MSPISEEQKWLLQFTQPANAPPTGAPWGDGTAMALRQKNNLPPWDANCRVKTLVGGYAAMSAMRDSLERIITEGSASSKNAGDRGYVYICDWRLNAFRDTSSSNDWFTGAWTPGSTAKKDQTVIGLILRLMQAGVQVRVLVWLPPTILQDASHIEDHFYIAKMIKAEDARLRKEVFTSVSKPIGIVALDRRVAGQVAASHHQKMLVIQGLSFQAAFCGGVDLAYTRRDSPPVADALSWQYDNDPPKFLNGDWQSGADIPDTAKLWPLDRSGGVVYQVNTEVNPPSHKEKGDLVTYVYGDGLSPQTQQFWHDQHLKLEGPVVTSLEEQFRERWADSAGTLEVLSSDPNVPDPLAVANDLVVFSTSEAFDPSTNQIKPLRPATTVSAPIGETGYVSTVQMWRTIPWRAHRSSLRLTTGEFTVMAGYAKASKTASELIWIFDQYFWSQPLARLLNSRLKGTPNLRLLLILPPYSDQDTGGLDTAVHHARQLALDVLTDGLSLTAGQFDQVAVYNLWFSSLTINRGIYCHAKTQTYDGSLLVCGSANLNRRSLMGDSEIACAVLDADIVNHHQRKLWSLLFPQAAWPTDANGNDIDLRVAGAGSLFFSAFNQAAQSGKSFLIPDPWKKGNSYRLPNGWLRQQDPVQVKFDAFYNQLMEATCIALDGIEGPIFDSTAPNNLRDPDLSEIVHRLSIDSRFEHDGEVNWTFRRPPPWVPPPWQS